MKLFDEKGELVKELAGDFAGDLIDFQGDQYRGVGWIVPPDAREQRYFAYVRVRRAPRPEPAKVEPEKKPGDEKKPEPEKK